MIRSIASVAAAATVCLGVAGCGARATGRSASERVQLRPAAVAGDTTASMPRVKRGTIRVGSEDGRFVGYIPSADIEMDPRVYMKVVNARTMWPVTDDDGAIVGYLAPDVPFVPLSVVQAPGFDIEKVRADREGGCEDQIGDPSFHQEFPPCDDGSGGGN